MCTVGVYIIFLHIYKFTFALVKDLDSLPDDDMYMGEPDEGETTVREESTVVDDPTLNAVPADISANNNDRSAPPTRQKDGQPLEPLHEVCTITAIIIYILFLFQFILVLSLCMHSPPV